MAEKFYYFTHGLCCMFFLIFGIRMLLKKDKERTQKVLTGTLLFWLFLQLKDLVLYSPAVERDGFVYNLVVLVDMWAVQVCSFYLFELLSAGWLTWRRIAALWSANLAITLAYVFSGNAVWVDVMLAYSIVYSVVFVVITYFAARRYNSFLRANYSDTTRKNIKWLKYTTIIFFICLLVWSVTVVYDSFLSDVIYLLSSLVLWSFIFHFGEMQESVPLYGNINLKHLFWRNLVDAAEDAANEPAGEESLGNGDAVGAQSNLPVQLQKAMETDEVFLNSRLTLTDLSALLGTNRTYLSVYLNNELHTTFYDYVNSYRIRKVVARLESSDEKTTMAEIAESCGFNSLSTFRRCFVREFGMTFAEYRRQHSRGL